MQLVNISNTFGKIKIILILQTVLYNHAVVEIFYLITYAYPVRLCLTPMLVAWSALRIHKESAKLALFYSSNPINNSQ